MIHCFCQARPEAPDFEGPEYEKPDGNPGAGNEETEEDKSAEKEEQAEGRDEEEEEEAPKVVAMFWIGRSHLLLGEAAEGNKGAADSAIGEDESDG